MVIRYCNVLPSGFTARTIRTSPETCLLGIGLHQYHYAPTCLGLFVDHLMGLTSPYRQKRTTLMLASLPLKNLWLFANNPPLQRRSRCTYRTALGFLRTLPLPSVNDCKPSHLSLQVDEISHQQSLRIKVTSLTRYYRLRLPTPIYNPHATRRADKKCGSRNRFIHSDYLVGD